ncbi:hypothetical protein NHE_0524 [Neorickettsia helminthoeca str. Oregon]|uniref:Uncharacterized protein n=1 Tax=Neorickettsia helminthoeca str. Oregon TaxID=1286528 RepID=X5HM02_9RICK|nr:hypothetical protein NHE_0524 [Neorickettsia helminthoeca str. Oregon]
MEYLVPRNFLPRFHSSAIWDINHSLALLCGYSFIALLTLQYLFFIS